MAEGKVMIKRVARLLPRDAIAYFKDNPDIWLKLKLNEEIEVPAEIVSDLKGIEIVKKKSVKKSKPKIEKEVNDGS